MSTPSPSLSDQLDFLSEHFNPLLALNSPNVVLPDPRARPLDNLYKCRQLLPSDHPEALDFEALRAARQAPKADLAKERTSYIMRKKQEQESRRNPLQEIMDAVTSGPLLLLKQICAERGRARVLTRHARGVRGTSTGTLVAFDKYMNMVLKDVEEDYTVLLRVERERPGKSSRMCRKQERRHRTLRQVFVRGESVVCVFRVQSHPAGPT